ncbi:hypothetical protein DDZ13_13425 [Coraliomargarita sinensis]|uniref:Response regulatory domain-containing protein n=1 Tax=Coraliomargarita sinensis TaxID=2174842 RepID=A0A317ZGY7_9BACT|nr:response regulator [Coraliomargarita sinensis]PXA03218.1 hypothetical protein DDZ13_13425 [Coraliomargarita sinensis]
MKHSLSSIKTLAAAQSVLSSEADQVAQLEEVLGLIGQTLEADRVGLFKLSPDAVLLEPLAHWSDEGVSKRDNTPLVVDALEELSTGVDNVIGEPIFQEHHFTGMLLIEAAGTDESSELEAREFIRNATVMLAPKVASGIDAPPPPKLHRPDEEPKADNSDDLHILIVEDDEANLFMIQKFIERFGAVPHAVRNGHDAIQICKEIKFDVILMDLTMPKLDGFDATREIVTGANLNRNTPIIAVTADVTDGIERRCRKIGMQHYIAKPIRRDTIIRALTDLTNKKPEQN